jgi:hypothetical protein
MVDDDKEIQIASINMIERYANNALMEIDLRVLELESRNQPEALRLWREIRRRVELLMSTTNADSNH